MGISVKPAATQRRVSSVFMTIGSQVLIVLNWLELNSPKNQTTRVVNRLHIVNTLMAIKNTTEESGIKRLLPVELITTSNTAERAIKYTETAASAPIASKNCRSLIAVRTTLGIVSDSKVSWSRKLEKMERSYTTETRIKDLEAQAFTFIDDCLKRMCRFQFSSRECYMREMSSISCSSTVGFRTSASNSDPLMIVISIDRDSSSPCTHIASR